MPHHSTSDVQRSMFDVHSSETSIVPPTTQCVPRRTFLRAISLSGLAYTFAPTHFKAAVADDKDGLPPGALLIVRSAKPLNAESALDDLVADWITPVEQFY